MRRHVIRCPGLSTAIFRSICVIIPCDASVARIVCPARAKYIASMPVPRSEEHTSELQSRENLVCRLLLEKKKNKGKSPETHKDRATADDITPDEVRQRHYG